MRGRGRLFILLGLILAVGAFVAAYVVVQGGLTPPPPPELPTVQVLVATQTIEARSQIPAEAVEVRALTVDQVPPNALHDPAELQGRFALFTIFPGQVIVQEMVTDKTEVQQSGLNAAFAVPPGTVAFAFPVSEFNTVAKAIQTGDFVDVLITITYTVVGAENTPLGSSLVTQLTLQDVEVLRVGSWGPPPPPPAEGEPPPPPSQNFLTLLLNHQDALVIKHLRDNTAFNVDFALRGVGDHNLVTTEAVTLDYLLTRFSIPESSTLPQTAP